MRNQIVALGLGSNLQNPIENLRRALTEIKKSSLFEVLDVASIYESDAQLPKDAMPDWQKKFLNSVVLCKVSTVPGTPVKPEELLYEVKQIEVCIGRQSAERWAPRLIDIDILYWNLEAYHSEQINIPHIRLCERPFALLPLLEVWDSQKHKIGLKLPLWASAYIEVKPFNTQKSKKYFWPKIVGILNITSDSFSDGGRFLNSESLQQQVLKLIDHGADIIDIGAESTRPSATFISEDAEYENLNWALDKVFSCSKYFKDDILISLDCRRPAVVRRILDQHRVDFLNDVSGFADIEMKKILKEFQIPAFVMHSLGVPPNLELTLDQFINPCIQLVEWWQDRNQDLLSFGISQDQLIFDPGIGFGKSKVQNLFILHHLQQLSKIKNDVMIGHSRKSFLSLFSDRDAEFRDTETALVTKDLNLAYVQYLRVHDVESQFIALKSRIM